MNIDVPLLRKTMEYIDEHPEEWDQASWEAVGSCGTTRCIAGTAVWLAGHTADYSLDRIDVVDEDTSKVYVDTTTSGHNIEDLAAKLLGFSPMQASVVFYSHNDDLAHTWRVLNSWTKGELKVPEKYL